MDEKNFKTMKSKSEKDVIKFYDDYAESWDSRFGSARSTKYFINSRWKVFKRIIGDKYKDKTALELGVGTGVYIDRCSKLFSHIIAVDGSEKMISELDKKLKRMKINNVSHHVSNVLNVKNVKSNSVDCVYFFGLIEHIIDTKAFLAEMKRVLKPGGIVVGVTPNGSSIWYKLRRLMRGTGKHCSTDKYYDDKMIKKLFKKNGFKFKKIFFWGGVPAGIESRFVLSIMKFAEKIVEKTFLRKNLGGMTFVFQK